ncbi:MAG: spore cortex biosynthesis protein YabQ [Bacillota bacterium]
MPLADQIVAFVWTLVMGMLAGLCYQVYRVIYDLLKLKKAGTFTGDIIFWLFLTAFAFIVLLKANYGQLRLYVFMGLLMGAFLFVRLLGDCTYRMARWVLYLAGQFLRLLALFLYCLWRVVTFPFRIVFITVIFPFHLAGRLMGRLGTLTGRLVGQPVNKVKDKTTRLAGELLRRLTQRCK